ncbi:MAG: hypothetical protein KGD64_01850 [Candidatus Heimdallarchaeota archaeon]|nr:hypothetical protein [Candidatus Heimdallarchaeota archaeon]
MISKKLLKLFFILMLGVLLVPNLGVDAATYGINIEHVEYCDLDDDGKEDDVYAEILVSMFEGTKNLIFKTTLKFDGEILHSIYRDNHVRTEDEMLYKFYFINVAYESGWYVLQSWFFIYNEEQSGFYFDITIFDPPGGDPDYPIGGGLDPGP